jgi:putative endonuclease
MKYGLAVGGARARWYVYLARCRDDTLYCGIARDVAARIAAHDAGTGARYTRGRGPLTVVLVRGCRDKAGALRLEHAIKQLTRAAKQALLAQPARLEAIVRRVRRARRERIGTVAAAKREISHADRARPGPAARATISP